MEKNTNLPKEKQTVLGLYATTKETYENWKANPDKVIIIDVRTPEEFYGGAYPGAVNIPLDELHTKVSELGSKSREIVLYCASGARSAYAQRGLMQMGFTNVKNGGGIMQMMRMR